MSFPAYNDYKDSGVEWLGEIPKDWDVLRFSCLANADDRKSFTDGDWIESPYITDEGVRLIQTGSIGVGEYREKGFRFISETTFSELNCSEVDAGDVLICRLAAPVGRACIAPALDSRMITSVDVCILKPNEHAHANYIVYMLSSAEYLGFMESQCRGGTRDRVSRSFLGSIPVAIPKLDEQKAISSFLDVETSKIDGLVSEQRRLIKLLKEKRQAVISHAVTKGLNPDARMKPSGIQWLCDVPEHWNVHSLRYVAKLKEGFAFSAADFSPEGVAVVRMNNLKRGELDLADAAKVPLTSCNDRVALAAGDLVWGMSGSTGETGSLGNYARVREQDLPCQLNQRVGRFRANETTLEIDFLEQLIQTPYFYEQILLAVAGTAQFNIGSEQVHACIITLPPRHEQAEIAAFIQERVGEFDSLEAEAERAIELLQERRKALISAAVTGKIDVREFASMEAML